MQSAIKFLIATLSLATLCTPLSAQPTLPFLKQKNPSSLGLFVWVSEDCPFSKEAAIKRVAQEYLQAKLTPTQNLSLNLTIQVDCLPIENASNKVLGIATYIETRWGTEKGAGFPVLYEPNYGSFLIAPTEGASSLLLDEIEGSVEMALSDYMRANY